MIPFIDNVLKRKMYRNSKQTTGVLEVGVGMATKDLTANEHEGSF